MLARVLGVLALAAALALAAPATADDRPRAGGWSQSPRGDATPQWRMVTPLSAATSGPALLAPRRSVWSDVVSRGGELFLRGRVEDYPWSRVVVQRKPCQTCSWRRHDLTRTGPRGGFRSRIGARRDRSTYWRAKVPASDGYTRSYSAVWATGY